MADRVQQQSSSDDTLTRESADILVSDSASEHTEECAEWLADAYRRWMKRSYPEDTALWRELFTPEMEMKRRRANCDADYVTRSQDYSEYGLRSISCRPLAEGWYEVTYAWREGEPLERIPVRVVRTDEGWRICYISPYWAEEQDYDKLFDITPDSVDDSGALSLVRTFYSRYAGIYALMDVELEKQLEALRQAHTTERFRWQFAEVRQSAEGEMDAGFDFVIMGNDFDIHSYRSLEVVPLEAETFRVSYHEDKECRVTWTVSVVCIDGHWKIDGIDACDHWTSSLLD